MTDTQPLRSSSSGADIRRAWIAAALTPAALSVGFVVGSLLLGDPNDPASPHDWDGAWRVVLLWALVETAPAAGVRWALRALRAGDPAAKAPLAVNALVFAFFVAVTLVAGLVDAFSG